MDQSLLSTLVVVILGGGFVGGIVALLKLKPEGDQILVSSAKDVVLIQKGALDDLRLEREEDRKRMEDLEDRMTEQLEVADRARRAAEVALVDAERERTQMARLYEAEQRRNTDLTRRVAALEAEVARLLAGRDQ